MPVILRPGLGYCLSRQVDSLLITCVSVCVLLFRVTSSTDTHIVPLIEAHTDAGSMGLRLENELNFKPEVQRETNLRFNLPLATAALVLTATGSGTGTTASLCGNY